MAPPDASGSDTNVFDVLSADVSTADATPGDASEMDVSRDADAADDASLDALDAGPATDASSSDGPLYCPIVDASAVDASPSYPTYPNICRNTLACNYPGDPGFDPCAPSLCDPFGGACLSLPAVPDFTPCDDQNPSTFVYPASGGCPSNKCVGGPNEGAACTSDSQCPDGSCFMNRCVDGPNAGSACSTNADCTGGAANADCVQQAGRESYCNGGSESGHFCPSVCSITGTQCGAAANTNTFCHRVCVGGSNPGTLCTPTGGQCSDGGVCTTNACLPIAHSPACPPVGRCVRWNADPQTGSCVATGDNPHCDTVADCPSTKYCAGDMENILGTPTTSCLTTGTTDDCCIGGGSVGPCLVWDQCDTNNHVCVRTTQGGVTTVCGNDTLPVYGPSCSGVATGSASTVCNDVCRAGRCTSVFAACK